MVSQLLLLLLCRSPFSQLTLELVDALGCPFAVVCEALHLATALDASCDLHASVHLLRDYVQLGHVFRRVVHEIEVRGLVPFLRGEIRYGV